MPLPLAPRPATLETAAHAPLTWRGAAVKDQESEFASMYAAEFTPVSRTVFLILYDRQRAEDITQNAFIQLYSHWGHPGSQLMSCRTDRTIPRTPSAPAQAINVMAPTPGETR